MPKSTKLATNVYPPEALPQRLKHFGRVDYEHVPAVFLSLVMGSKQLLGDQNVTYLINLARMYPYTKPEGQKILFAYLKENRMYNIFVLGHENNSYQLYRPAASFEALDLQAGENLTDEQITMLMTMGNQLADHYVKQLEYQKAFTVYSEMIKWAPNDAALLRKMARVCGSLGKVEMHKDYLSKIVDLGISNSLPEKRLLMELYYVTNDFYMSRYWAERLLLEDPDDGITYLRWLFKILQEGASRAEWQQLYHKVSYLPIKRKTPEDLERIVLLKEIEETIAANPEWYEILQDEQKRWEKIQLPE